MQGTFPDRELNEISWSGLMTIRWGFFATFAMDLTQLLWILVGCDLKRALSDFENATAKVNLIVKSISGVQHMSSLRKSSQS